MSPGEPAAISSGDVLPSYAYLWHWQQARGEETGRKGRPACVALAAKRVSKSGSVETHLLILAITGTAPTPEQRAVPVPETERRRIGLDANRDAWIVVSEYNTDVLERSFVVEPPKARLKRLSDAFLKVVVQALKDAMATKDARRIDRA